MNWIEILTAHEIRRKIVENTEMWKGSISLSISHPKETSVYCCLECNNVCMVFYNFHTSYFSLLLIINFWHMTHCILVLVVFHARVIAICNIRTIVRQVLLLTSIDAPSCPPYFTSIHSFFLIIPLVLGFSLGVPSFFHSWGMQREPRRSWKDSGILPNNLAKWIIFFFLILSGFCLTLNEKRKDFFSLISLKNNNFLMANKSWFSYSSSSSFSSSFPVAVATPVFVSSNDKEERNGIIGFRFSLRFFFLLFAVGNFLILVQNSKKKKEIERFATVFFTFAHRK